MLQPQVPHIETIVVVIPVFNEGRVLRTVIQSLLEAAVTHIVVVDDGSEQPVLDMVGDLPVFVVRHKANLGQGAALQTGFEYAKKLQPDIVITFDADGQHHVADLPALMKPITTGEADVVLGSRFLAGNATGISFSKRMVLQLARIINFLLCGIWLSDAHNGLRALNRTALHSINLTENRMAHASEMLFEIKQNRLRLQEVPVQIHYTGYSMQKGQSAWNGIKILFDLVLHKLFK
jgi:polyprenyl-phospho-N-acetylgalactosaminyl synthase